MPYPFRVVFSRQGKDEDEMVTRPTCAPIRKRKGWKEGFLLEDLVLDQSGNPSVL